MSVRRLLACFARPLKRNAVLVEERQRLVDGAGVDVIGELTCLIVSFLRAKLPDDLEPGAGRRG